MPLGAHSGTNQDRCRLRADENKKYNSTSRKHFRVMYTHYTPLLYSKTGVCRGIPIFLIFVQKHRIWVLVRTASSPQSVCAKIRKISTFSTKNFHFYNQKISVYCMALKSNSHAPKIHACKYTPVCIYTPECKST